MTDKLVQGENGTIKKKISFHWSQWELFLTWQHKTRRVTFWDWFLHPLLPPKTWIFLKFKTWFQSKDQEAAGLPWKHTQSTRRAFNLSGETVSNRSWLLILKRKHRGLWSSGEISADWQKARRTRSRVWGTTGWSASPGQDRAPTETQGVPLKRKK